MYTVSNCVACCKSCNFTKGSRLSYQEMLAVGKMRRLNEDRAEGHQAQPIS